MARHLRLNPDALEAHGQTEAGIQSIRIFPHGFAMFNTKYEDMTGEQLPGLGCQEPGSRCV